MVYFPSISFGHNLFNLQKLLKKKKDSKFYRGGQ